MKTNAASQARQVILSRIRAALPPQADAVSAERSWETVSRAYRRGSEAPRSTVLALLTDRLHDYGAQVVPSSVGAVTEAVAQLLVARGAATLLVPEGFPASLLPEGFTYMYDADLSPAELDGCDGVITTCTLAIAETGTIVLQGGAGQGRRAASLVPDYHLCLIEAARVFATVSEAISALQETAALPTTFVSGPSATADIEMTRIKGVHGPRFLDVILIT